MVDPLTSKKQVYTLERSLRDVCQHMDIIEGCTCCRAIIELRRLTARVAELEETTHPIEVSRAKNAEIVRLRALLDTAVVAIRTKFAPPQGWLKEAEIAVGHRRADETDEEHG